LASLTVHVTAVEPAGNFEPLGGLQVGPVNGVEPRATVANPYVTTAPDESVAWTDAGALGQVIVGAPGSTGGVVVGCVGESPHAAATATLPRTTSHRTDAERVIRLKR